MYLRPLKELVFAKTEGQPEPTPFRPTLEGYARRLNVQLELIAEKSNTITSLFEDPDGHRGERPEPPPPNWPQNVVDSATDDER